MKQTVLWTVTVLLIPIIMLIGSGCSDGGSVNPVNTDPAFEANQVEALSRPEEPTTFVETFDSRRNVGGWSFFTTHRPTIESAGGNPGGYLHDDHVVTFAPKPGTALGEESIFTGDYRARKITSVGIDLRCIDYEWDITTRYLTLMLMNDNGTPFETEDDWGAYVFSDVHLPSKYVAWLTSTSETDNEPGWVSYDFEIASQGSELPEGWSFIRLFQVGAEMPSGSWTRLMQNVSYVEFLFGDPLLYYILQSFDLGLDNPRISWEE
ncbi:MAG: hypothetical protein JSV52_00075 [Candidatus Zixiibacteriota bacterium]|nr:MAG: hypothetical protein JSV52_00075 [candidate division Zixibacteria bacterium]